MRCSTECEPRNRRSRATQGEEGIWNRLARLERVIDRLGDETNNQVQPDNDEPMAKDDEAAGQEASVRDEQPSIHAIASQYIGSEIWISLAEEVQALRVALEEEHGTGTDDVVASESHMAIPPLGRNSTFDFILSPPGSVFVISGAGVELEELLRTTLCDLFCQNIDRIFKVFHVPSLRALLIQDMPYLGKGRTAPCNVALKATVYFAAIITLSAAQCESLFGRSRVDQIEHFRRVAEVAMTEANLLNTMDLATLQAFVVLIVSTV